MNNHVTVVIAIYNPNIRWLREQLASVDAQNYKYLDVIACDDASDTEYINQIEEAFFDCLKHVPYKLIRNNVNLGSDLTYERLTSMAQGKFISFCDQDDVWVPSKTAVLVDMLCKSNSSLVYSDLSIINEDSQYITGSLRDVRHRLTYMEGGLQLAETLLFKNFTNGTAIMMPANVAKAAIPFVMPMTADHWLSLWAASHGKITYVPDKLVYYRLHGSNQSAVMSKVSDKQSYNTYRIQPGISRFTQYETRLCDCPQLKSLITDGQKWFAAREQWFLYGKAANEVWKLRRLGKQVSYFELLCARLPEPIFMSIIRLVQRGVL